jgi:hypothetical protein
VLVAVTRGVGGFAVPVLATVDDGSALDDGVGGGVRSVVATSRVSGFEVGAARGTHAMTKVRERVAIARFVMVGSEGGSYCA